MHFTKLPLAVIAAKGKQPNLFVAAVAFIDCITFFVVVFFLFFDDIYL
jgi:hypothetical protein